MNTPHKQPHVDGSLKQFPESNPSPVLRIDAHGIVLYANPASDRLLCEWKCLEGEPVPQGIRDVVTEVLLTRAAKELEITINTDVYLVMVVPVKNCRYVHMYGYDVSKIKQNENVFLSRQHSLELELAQRTDEFYLNAHELSNALIKKKNAEKERDATEDKMREMQNELARARRLAEIGTVAATVAHELKNPLGVIQTALFNIERKNQNASLDKHLKNIEKKVAESNHLINNLLAYPRITSPDYHDVHIYELIDECISAVQKTFFDYHVTVQKEFLFPRGHHIRADVVHLTEIVTNILSNAFQSFPDKYGRIIVQTVLEEGDTIVITIRDNGAGMDHDVLKKARNAFFTTKDKGTGLGLAICHKLICLHQGSMDIASTKGEGTVVAIRLPLSEKKADTPA